MVKRCYIQDYPENFRGNTETRTIASADLSASKLAIIPAYHTSRRNQAAGGGDSVLNQKVLEKLEKNKSEERKQMKEDTKKKAGCRETA